MWRSDRNGHLAFRFRWSVRRRVWFCLKGDRLLERCFRLFLPYHHHIARPFHRLLAAAVVLAASLPTRSIRLSNIILLLYVSCTQFGCGASVTTDNCSLLSYSLIIPEFFAFYHVWLPTFFSFDAHSAACSPISTRIRRFFYRPS